MLLADKSPQLDIVRSGTKRLVIEVMEAVYLSFARQSNTCSVAKYAMRECYILKILLFSNEVRAIALISCKPKLIA